MRGVIGIPLYTRRRILRALRINARVLCRNWPVAVAARVAQQRIRWPVDSRMQIVAARNDKLTATGHSYGHWLIAIYLQISRVCARLHVVRLTHGPRRRSMPKYNRATLRPVRFTLFVFSLRIMLRLYYISRYLDDMYSLNMTYMTKYFRRFDRKGKQYWKSRSLFKQSWKRIVNLSLYMTRWEFSSIYRRS